MTNGVVIIAHNNRQVDYARMALISGGFAKKNLKVPVSLITDESTVQWMHESKIYEKASNIFEKIILVDRPVIDNHRVLYDGTEVDNVPFINSNRFSAYDLSPYDRTLLIDSDFMIMSDNLNNYWNVDEDVLISESINDIQGNRIGVLDKWTSETGVHLYWATAVLFSKSEKSKLFFDLVKFIKENYKYYADLFRFKSAQYRNDISFSIAKHILDGFEKSNMSLPPLLTIQDKDIIEKIDDGKLIVCIKNLNDPDSFYLGSIKNQDVHIMNKQSIIRCYDQFERLL
jgi:hypothetical protein